jgi:preprotein translocase subunit YajC
MFATLAYAQATSAAAPGGSGSLTLLLPYLLLIPAFYFLILRPQQRRAKMQAASIAAVKKGDEVVTAGGHIGKVTKVSDNEVEVEFAAGQRHRVIKTTLAEVRPLGSAKPAND